MSEDLQDDNTVVDDPSKKVEDGTVLDADTGENQEKKQDSDINEKTQKVINRKHFEAKEAERKAEAETLRADNLQKRLTALEQEQQKPGDIPPMPDQYDDDFAEKMVIRDAAIRDQAVHDSNLRNTQNQEADSQLAAQQQKQVAVNKRFTDYNARAAEFGMTPETVATISAVGNSLNADLTAALMKDPDGPLIIQHLYNHTDQIDALNGMALLDVGTFINEKIRPLAAELKPKTSSTPDPATNVGGDGVDVDAGKFPYSKGARFE